MATLLKRKDAQRDPKSGLELGICAATIPTVNVTLIPLLTSLLKACAPLGLSGSEWSTRSI